MQPKSELRPDPTNPKDPVKDDYEQPLLLKHQPLRDVSGQKSPDKIRHVDTVGY